MKVDINVLPMANTKTGRRSCISLLRSMDKAPAKSRKFNMTCINTSSKSKASIILSAPTKMDGKKKPNESIVADMIKAIAIKPIVEGSFITVIFIKVKAAAKKIRKVINSNILIDECQLSLLLLALKVQIKQ